MSFSGTAVQCQARTLSGEQCQRSTKNVPPDCGKHPRPDGHRSSLVFSPDALGERAWLSRQIEEWGGLAVPYRLDAEFRAMTALRLQDRRDGRCRCPHGLCGVHGFESDDPAAAFLAVHADATVKAYTPEVAERAAQCFAKDFDPENPESPLGWGWPYLTDSA